MGHGSLASALAAPASLVASRLLLTLDDLVERSRRRLLDEAEAVCAWREGVGVCDLRYLPLILMMMMMMILPITIAPI